MAGMVYTGSQAMAADSVYLLQLGSFEKEILAKQRWVELQQQFPSELKDLGVRISSVTLPPDDYIVYRTQAGPYQTRAQAQDVCDALQSMDEECYVVQTAMFTPQTFTIGKLAPSLTEKAKEPASQMPSQPSAQSAAAMSTKPVVPMPPSFDMPPAPPVPVQKVKPSVEPEEESASIWEVLNPFSSEEEEDEKPELMKKERTKEKTAQADVPQSFGEERPDNVTSQWQEVSLAPMQPQPQAITSSPWAPDPFASAQGAAMGSVTLTPKPRETVGDGVSYPQTPPSVQKTVAVNNPIPPKNPGDDVPVKQMVSVAPPKSVQEAMERAVPPPAPPPAESTASGATLLQQMMKSEPASTEGYTPPPPTPEGASQPIHAAPQPFSDLTPRVGTVDQRPVRDPLDPSGRLVPSAPPIAAQPGANVNVAEAIRVPVTEEDIVEDTTPSMAQELAKVQGYPSAPTPIATNWVQLSYFIDQQNALSFWEAYRLENPAFPSVRVRVTKPYMFARTDPRVSLRIGPFENENVPRDFCDMVKDLDMRCFMVTDLGMSSPKHGATSIGKSSYDYRRNHAQNMDDHYWVQLGAFHSPDHAQEAWGRMQRDHTLLLTALSPDITTAGISSSATNAFRLRAGPYRTRIPASRLCATLRSRGESCVVIHGN